ncbi:hypothetical protein Clacol_010250 [Clathrus columnatus]|uniref:Uncharacterized protein n=1 Tax=Clathrus columnatus TaxID=1419009 RepID=A0AAV5AT82_9AGAM|nr:hypothetical protein Clacol_010250 [Clathrus columnatus]
MITACFPLLITGVFELCIRLPIRVSSLPPNEPLPPGAFTLVEDIIAVDGHGGLEFRKAWRARYEASTIMRKLLRDLSIFWGATGTIAGAAFIVVSWTTTDDIAIGVGYGLPWLWAIVCALISIKWTRRELKREREELHEHPQLVKRQVSLHIRDDKPEQQNIA